ncbi:MAG: ribonuclease HII [Candidatus Parvarchaeota archaeon]|jgi:ribonuclease H, mammalian HI/archaeal HII subfamily|nr:ribonuclease HII [Candidatus Parvarchaeota archaeon]
MNRIGIDEAGRGPIIGPLIVAGVSSDQETAAKFKVAGVKDSKLLSIKRIYLLERLIVSECSGYSVEKISPEAIDSRFADGTNLNFLELDRMAKIANALVGDTVIIDSPSANTKKIKAYMAKQIPNKNLIVENYADKNHIEVSAASIIAKALREREVEAIKKELDYDFGSGYPSDPLTIKFIKIIKENGLIREEKYSKHVRKTWATLKNLDNKNLNEFVDR